MLTETEILDNWNIFLEFITEFISSPRKEQLLKFYDKREVRFSLMTCSSKESYHNCFPGGYIDHVNRVVEMSFQIKQLWENTGAVIDFTDEELAFVALNHDLGKYGEDLEEYYIPQTNDWYVKNKGEIYTINPKVKIMHTTDRTLFLLQQEGIPLSYNEYIGIRLHDGLYEEPNKYYYINYSTDKRLQSNLPYIISQADLAAARIEYDISLKSKKGKTKSNTTVNKFFK